MAVGTGIQAFSLDQVSRLTGLSERQLAYWDETGFFTPHYATDNRRRPYSRVYSYRDVVGLRTLGLLRNKHRVPLQGLRLINDWLQEQYETPWAQLRFWVRGREVFFEDPRSGERVASRSGAQVVIPIEMEQIARQTEQAVAALGRRTPDQIGRIVRNRYVQSNAWVLAGTRVPTWAIWEMHEAGLGTAEILRQFSSLTPDDIRAAIEHERELQPQQRAG